MTALWYHHGTLYRNMWACWTVSDEAKIHVGHYLLITKLILHQQVINMS